MNLVIYKDPQGFSPFEDWLNGLSDKKTKARILVRLDRLIEGNFGDYKFLNEGIGELRFTFGPGFRIYFGMLGKDVIILLIAGDKSSQQKDIIKAKTYFQDYLNGKNL